jgi:hypothetical protein
MKVMYHLHQIDRPLEIAVKIQLKGHVLYAEEVHTDCFLRTEEICEEFDAKNKKEGINNALRLAANIISRYPIGGDKEFHKLDASIRIVKEIKNLVVPREAARLRTPPRKPTTR